MSPIRVRWQLAVGWIVGLCAVVALLVTWLGGGISGGGHVPAPAAGNAVPGDRRATSPSARAATQAERPRKPKPQSASSGTAEAPLRDFLAAGELGAVHEELARLAEARELATVGGLLKTWCREGSVEVAQWCLAITRESDADLNLKICVDALSNPSEVIREIAASQLEEASGTRFSDPAQARSWLATRFGP